MKSIVYTACLSLVLIGSAGLSSCKLTPGSQSVNQTPRTLWRTELPTPDAMERRFDGVLLVRPFEVDDPFDRSAFLRRDGEGRYQADPYHQFAARPSEQFANATRDWLRSTGLFTSVVSEYSTLRPRYVLETTVTEIAGVESRDSREAVLTIRYLLIDRDATPDTSNIIADLTRSEIVPVDSLRSADLARAWDQALRQSLEVLLTEIDKQ